MSDSLLIGGGSAPSHLLLRYANRHGLVAGATGTGKTVTVQGLAEGFSAAGVPVIVADVKGDLCGIAMPGSPGERIAKRAG
jgi:DNA helicase HerA-like ATPase